MSESHSMWNCSGKGRPDEPCNLSPGERAGIYRGLAFLYGPPTWDRVNGPLARLLLRHPGYLLAGQPYIQVAREMDRVEREAYGLGLEAFQAEHVRLFVNGPDGVAAPPYASFYSESRLLGQAARQAVAFYERFHLTVDPSCQEPPDHIVFELEFLCLACSLEQEALDSDDPETAGSLGRAQAEFFLEHLFSWAHAFCQRVLRNSNLAFYQLLAAFTIGFFLEERKCLERACAGRGEPAP